MKGSCKKQVTWQYHSCVISLLMRCLRVTEVFCTGSDFPPLWWHRSSSFIERPLNFERCCNTHAGIRIPVINTACSDRSNASQRAHTSQAVGAGNQNL